MTDYDSTASKRLYQAINWLTETGEKANPEAWRHLLLYCPDEILYERVAKLLNRLAKEEEV